MTVTESIAKPVPHDASIGRNLARMGSALALPALGFIAIGLLWQMGSFALGRYLPPPIDVARAAFDNLFQSRYLVGLGMPEGGFLPHLISTVLTVISGLAIGALVGTTTGSLAAYSPIVTAVFNPIINVFGNIPIMVAAPFFLIWFGVAEASKVLLVALYSAVLLHVFMYRAIRNVRPHFVEYARTLGAPPLAIYRQVHLPGALPELFGGLRAALGASWGLAAITELLGSTSGVGRIIITAWGVSDVALMLAGLFWLCLIALACDGLLMAARRYVLRWM